MGFRFRTPWQLESLCSFTSKMECRKPINLFGNPPFQDKPRVSRHCPRNPPLLMMISNVPPGCCSSGSLDWAVKPLQRILESCHVRFEIKFFVASWSHLNWTQWTVRWEFIGQMKLKQPNEFLIQVGRQSSLLEHHQLCQFHPKPRLQG